MSDYSGYAPTNPGTDYPSKAAALLAALSIDTDKVDVAQLGFQFGQKRSTTTGLTYGYYGGTINVAGVPTSIADGTIALSASATNYVEFDSTGAVSKNTTGFTVGRFPMAQIVTGAATITSVTDKRALVDLVYRPSATVAQNFVVNGSGEINQRADAAARADDTYGHDRWYRLAQSNPIAVSNLTDVEDGMPRMMRLTQPNATAQRMGYAQIIEGKDCKRLRGRTVTFRFGRMRLSTAANVRIAVLEWTGTEDVVTSDVVNDWTSGSYTAGGFFLGASLTVSGVVQQALAANTLTDGSSVTVQLGSAFNNLIVLAWTEGTVAQNVTLDLAKAKLEDGGVASPYQAERVRNALADCQRHYWKTPGAGFAYYTPSNLTGSGSNFVRFLVPNPVFMRVAPAVTILTQTQVDRAASNLSVSGNTDEYAINLFGDVGTTSGTAGWTGITLEASSDL